MARVRMSAFGVVTTLLLSFAPQMASAQVPTREGIDEAATSVYGMDPAPAVGSEEIAPVDEALGRLHSSGQERVIIDGVLVLVSDLKTTSDGSWSIDFTPITEDGTPIDLQMAGYTASVCVGRFYDPYKIGGSLQWGAEQTCSGNYAPQYIRMRLQSTCTSYYCQRFTDETAFLRTPFSEDNTRVSRRNFYPTCDTSNFRKYRIEAIPYVRGVSFSPKFSEERVQACDISA